jgi:hypothetical protein
MMAGIHAGLAPLARALGTWAVAGRHPFLPGRVLQGRVAFEPIEGGAFVRMRSRMDDPQFPEGVAIFGTDGQDGRCCRMLYFDTRGVARIYDVEFHADGFAWSRAAPDLAQRFRVAIAGDGRTMEGRGEMSRQGGAWEKDLDLDYERLPDGGA